MGGESERKAKLRCQLRAKQARAQDPDGNAQAFAGNGADPSVRSFKIGLDIPIWILGSSLYGAQLAAMLGLPYAFASHFAPQMLDEAIRVYRQTFTPSEQLDKPYVMLGFNAFVADSDEEAELLSTSVQQAFVALRTGQPTKLPPPKPGYAETLPLQSRAILRSVLSCSAIGSPETARRQVAEFVDRYRPDELMVTAQIYDHQARLRSYELLMEAVRQSEPVPAK